MSVVYAISLLQPADLPSEASIAALGSGVVGEYRRPTNTGAALSFRAVVKAPWRLPGTRMLGAFKTVEFHDCDQLEAAGVFLFENRTDFVDGGGVLPLWIVVFAQYERGRLTSCVYTSPAAAENHYYYLIGVAEFDCEADC
jgi:hypothetical protein